ncbi:glycosyltransferase family 39 protein [Candidatus Woesearchaeota archaeon]|nr:glycosyltransferase family 39 protein [Candidatus Woesearchaeota archaeon]
MKSKTCAKYTKLSIAVIITAIIIRFALASIYTVSGDACWQLSNSKFIAENNKLPLFEQFGRDEPFWPPPLFHVVSALVYGVFTSFGENIADFAIKMISPVFGSLAIIFFFLISKSLFNEKIAFYSLLFFAFVPLSMDYSVFAYVDSTITFLAVLSVYLSLKNKIVASSITAGLAILAKYNGIFILPILLYIVYQNNKNKKYLLKNVLIISIIPLALGSVWFIRNWIYLGNPVWPFLNSIFHGFAVKTFAEAETGSVNFLNIFSISGIIAFYLGAFGVPNGNISALSFFQIPYLSLLFTIWLLATIIFLVPLLIGISSYKKLNHRKLLSIWIGSYIALILLYVVNASWSVARFMLPAFPAIALIWAHGMQKIRFPNIKKALMVLIILIAVGFVFTSFVKISLATKSWNFYNDDFEWAKSNTHKTAKFMTGGQCISYNIERQTISPEINNLEKADYIWVNQNFSLDRRSVLNTEIIQRLNKDKMELAYENKKTGTKIYKIAS